MTHEKRICRNRERLIIPACLVIVLQFFCITITKAKEWSVAGRVLTLNFDDLKGSFRVRDNRSRQVWNQKAQSGLRVSNVARIERGFSISFEGTEAFSCNVQIEQDTTLLFKVTASPRLKMQHLEYPGPFQLPDKSYYLISTDGEGMLLQGDDREYPVGAGLPYSCGGGLSMPWMGVTDGSFERGYMAVLETPYDATFRTARADNLITFCPQWLASMGEFGYERAVRYVFFNKGGYVAQCKYYRKYVWKQNGISTLRSREAQLPAISKLRGAVHMYLWDNARNESFVRELKESGVSKAMILWDPNHAPYPAAGFDAMLKSLNYVTGGYELFSDTHLSDTSSVPADATLNLKIGFPGLYNRIAAKKPDGTSYSNQFGHYVCPLAIRPYISPRIDKVLATYPHETFFLDVYQANGLYECYQPDHRVTREQWADAIKQNQKLIVDRSHTFLGAEWGADFANAQTVYVHGMMTLQRTWFNSDITKKGTIYYYGDWKNNARPTQMLGTRTAPPKYLQYSINEHNRIPLYELVYHDAVVTSWRWEDASNHTPEIWYKKDLFNMLYGSAPLWNLDRETWDKYKNTFLASYRQVMPWVEQIAYDELLSHRFVTVDHQVQESVFSSGKRLIVNFGEHPFDYQGKQVPARGYVQL